MNQQQQRLFKLVQDYGQARFSEGWTAGEAWERGDSHEQKLDKADKSEELLKTITQLIKLG